LDGEEKARPKGQHLLAFFVTHSTINCIEKTSKENVESEIARCHNHEELLPRQVAKKEE